eukprot:CAMPEP_0172939670 /NCGR_PEP_ID=MMETSP1075-20121228/223646_1 /TAXON_ID=2916 /ORGANISM="Ceratium fusus, Strain PA161109" /LENGTH=474 /DNA_ID=CAMNT_0013801061 /DNA_START=27 /DNA_END=1451 /DNA_ORIENTATION=-
MARQVSPVHTVVGGFAKQVTPTSVVVPASRQVTSTSVVMPSSRQVTKQSLNMQRVTSSCSAAAPTGGLGVTVNANPMVPAKLPQGIKSVPAGVNVITAPVAAQVSSPSAVAARAIVPPIVGPAALPRAVRTPVITGHVTPPLTDVPPLSPAPAVTSVVPMPQVPALMEAPMMAPVPSKPPAKLTDGMPNPQEVAQQKKQFVRCIMVQHKEKEAILQQQAEHEIHHARSVAARYKALVFRRLEVQRREEEMAAEHEYLNQLANLREAACRKRAALERQAGMAPVPSKPPAKLTDGMPNPQEVAQQKQEFARHIMVQHKENEAILEQQAEHEIQHARRAAERYKALVLGRLEVQRREEEMAAEHEYHTQLANLREAACQKRAALEKQAGDLVMEYSARKAQDDMNRRNHQIQFQQWEAGRNEQMFLEPPESESGRLRLMQQLGAQHQEMKKRVDAGLPELPVNGWVPEVAGLNQAS